MYTPDPDEKFDFQNMDVKLYLALRALHTDAKTFAESGDSGNPYDDECFSKMMKNAERTMYEFQQSFGPIPDWAVARNFGYELVAGAQLCTRDGRKTGNAHIVSIEQIGIPHLAPYSEITAYNCLTDAGYKFVFSAQELETCFTIGDWISDPERVIRDFDRNGEFRDEQ